MNVCLIPARGGSKRIPRKNIRPFCGKPMILWSIEAAKAAACFDRIIVSTDDAEIAQIARDAGVEVPFTRPTELADDHATTLDVIRHALGWLEEHDATPDRLCCLYATAPFVKPDDIRQGLDLMDGVDFAMPLTTFAFPIQRAVKRVGQGLEMFDPDQALTRSQDLEEAWHDAGQFYWGTAEAWREDRPVFGPNTRVIELPRWRVQDIDTEEDWERAEALFKAMSLSE